MGRKCCAFLTVCLTVLAMMPGARCSVRHETEEQLRQRIQGESNPVKKAKDEIKLAHVQFSELQDAYAQGHIDEGAKLLGTFMDSIRTAWKLLQSSGHNASKHPEGFRELEIFLREHVRSLQDLGRTVSYLDRAPLESAGQEMDHIRGEVLHALFPGGLPRPPKGSPAPKAQTSAQTPTEAR